MPTYLIRFFAGQIDPGSVESESPEQTRYLAGEELRLQFPDDHGVHILGAFEAEAGCEDGA